MLKRLTDIEFALAAILKPIIAFGVFSLIAAITLQVATRVLFTSASWTEEIARYLLIWITFLGATLAYQQKRHIAVLAILDILPYRLRSIANVTSAFVAIVFLSTLAYAGWEYMSSQSFQKSPTLEVKMAYIYSVLPITAILMMVLSLIDLLRAVLGHLQPTNKAGIDT